MAMKYVTSYETLGVNLCPLPMNKYKQWYGFSFIELEINYAK